jgi:hypothetical protein
LALTSEAEADEGGPISRVLASDVHGNYYKGVLRDFEITNPGELLPDLGESPAK